MKVFVISDTHFNHELMVESEGRPADFNEVIIQNWNHIVGENDLVIHLGDVILGRASELAGIMERLSGTKVLVMGNHDTKKFSWYLNKGFSFACDSFVLGSVMFTHEPVDKLPDGVSVNVHGHLHSGKYRSESYPHETHRLVQIEDSLSPVNLDRVVSRSLLLCH